MENRSLSRLMLFTAVLVGAFLQLAPYLAAETPMPGMHWRKSGLSAAAARAPSPAFRASRMSSTSAR